MTQSLENYDCFEQYIPYLYLVHEQRIITIEIFQLIFN